MKAKNLSMTPHEELKQLAADWSAELSALDNTKKTEQEVIWRIITPFGTMSRELNDIIEEAHRYIEAREILELAADLEWQERDSPEERKVKWKRLRALVNELNQASSES